MPGPEPSIASQVVSNVKGATDAVVEATTKLKDTAVGKVLSLPTALAGGIMEGMDQLMIPVCSFLQSVMAKINDAIKYLLSKLKLIRDMLRKLKELAMYPFNRAKDLLNSFSSALDQIGKALSMKNDVKSLTDALKGLLDCPFIADTSIGAAIAAVIDMIKEGANFIASLIGQLKSAISSTVGGLLDKLSNLVSKTLGAVESEYAALLRTSGILSLAQKLLDVQKCISKLCKAYKVASDYIQNDIPDPLTALGIVADKTGRAVVKVFDTEEGSFSKEASELCQKSWWELKKKKAQLEAMFDSLFE